jgi:hypothetical protein
MKKLLGILLLTNKLVSQTNDYIAISKKLVEAAKAKNIKATNYMDLIAKADETLLSNNLKEIQKKAFFINVYNGFTNISYARSEQYKDRGAF